MDVRGNTRHIAVIEGDGIGRLRHKVEPDPKGEPRGLRTVRNAGYMFVPLD